MSVSCTCVGQSGSQRQKAEGRKAHSRASLWTGLVEVDEDLGVTEWAAAYIDAGKKTSERGIASAYELADLHAAVSSTHLRRSSRLWLPPA